MQLPQSDEDGSFDVRFLVFEFLFGHLLRGMQIDLVRRFVDDALHSRSRVAQLIMGAVRGTHMQ